METIIEERQNRREKTEIDNNKTKHEKGETRILYLNGQQLCVPKKSFTEFSLQRLLK